MGEFKLDSSTYKLEFLMPCLCGGANLETAELRPSAVRGQLRWWFRALGGSFEEESAVFGRIGKKNEALGSAVVIRTRILGKPPVWEPPEFGPKDPESYVWYFASVSGKTEDDKKNKLPGPRWQSEGALAEGTKWELRVIVRRPLYEALRKKFDDALTCFLALGSIGLRATRGLGTFHCIEKPFDENVLRPILEKARFAMERKGYAKDYAEMARTIGSLVKGTRKAKGWKNDSKTGTETPSPLGSSNNPRQTSAIWFRPVRVPNADDRLLLVVFEAPHDRILGEVSRSEAISVGKNPSELFNEPLFNRRK